MSVLFQLVFLLLFSVSLGGLYIDDSGSNILNKLIDIYDEYFDYGYSQSSVVVVSKEVEDRASRLIGYVHRSLRCRVITMGFTYGCGLKTKFQNQVTGVSLVGYINMMYVFVEEENLNETVNCFKSTTGKFPSKTILVYERTNQTEIERTFRLLWSQKILNVIIVTDQGVIGYNPFRDVYYQDLGSANLFFDKLQDLNGHPLRVFHARPEDFSKVRVSQVGNQTRYSGKDGMTIQTIIQHINATFVVIDLHEIFKNDNPWRWLNKNRTEYLREPAITRYKPDLFFDSLDLEYTNVTDFIFPHAKNDLVVCLPKTGFKPPQIVLYEIFKKGFFLIILFFLIFCPIVWFILVRIEQTIEERPSLKIHLVDSIAFNTIRAFLGLAFTTPRTNFIHNFFLMWMLFSNLVVNTYFQCVLTSLLTIDEAEPDIKTIKELAGSKHRPYSVQAKIDELAADYQTKSYAPKFQVMPHSLFYDLNYKDPPRNFSIMFERDRIEALIMICPIFYIMKEVLTPNYISYVVAKGSPYFAVLEKYVPRIIESGLHRFWRNQNNHIKSLEVGQCGLEHDGIKFVALGMDNFLSMAFYVLVFGWVVSSIVFFVELSIYTRTKPKLQFVL